MRRWVWMLLLVGCAAGSGPQFATGPIDAPDAVRKDFEAWRHVNNPGMYFLSRNGLFSSYYYCPAQNCKGNAYQRSYESCSKAAGQDCLIYGVNGKTAFDGPEAFLPRHAVEVRNAPASFTLSGQSELAFEQWTATPGAAVFVVTSTGSGFGAFTCKTETCFDTVTEEGVRACENAYHGTPCLVYGWRGKRISRESEL
jgi:hypothetical protein